MEKTAKEKYWSRFPDTYDKNQEYVVGKDFLDEIKRKLNKLPELGKTVELACGTGVFTQSIISKTTHLVATDLSDELLEIASKRLVNNSNVMIQKENCMATSFASGEFDCVFMANLIHVVEKPAQVLQECHRILKKGGMLIVVSYTNTGMHLLEKIKLGIRFLKVWGKPPRHIHSISPEKLAALMKNAGFVIEEAKLLGNRTKAVFVTGKKAGDYVGGGDAQR